MVEFKPLEKKHVEFKPLNYTPAKETELYDFSKVDGTYYRSENGLNVQPTNKIDFVLSALNMIPNKPKPVQDMLDSANYVNKTLENTDFSKIASEGAKSLGRQTLNLFSGATGSMMRIYGDLGYADEEKYKDILDTPFVKANNAVFGTIRDFGKAIEDTSDRLQQSDFLKADNELFKGDIYDNPNLHKFVDLAMSGSASLVGTYGIARMSNPMIALWTMSGADAKDIYFGAREAGESKLKSAALFAAGTAGTAKLEQIGLEKVFNIKFNKTNIEPIIKGTKDTVKKIAQAIVAEGGEEGVQTVYQNAVKKYGYDDTQDLYEGAVESMIGGALGGGLVASVNFGIERFRGTADRLGVSEEEQNQFLETTAQAIADNPDLIDIPFQENMKKTYNSFTQMINELGDSPEAERLKQTKLDLDEGYNKYYEQFKTYMPEVQAKANADLIRSSALFFSDLEGMSVKDWFEKKAPQVIKTNDIMQQVRDFQSRVNPVKYRVAEEDINLFEALKYPDIMKKYERKGRNLIQFIRKSGGIKDVGGELKNMDIGKQFRGVINNKSGMGLDDMTLAAWEYGYLPDSDFNYGRPDIQTLLDAIRDESFGTHHYGEDTERTVYDDVEDLREQLDRMGIDWQKLSPKEIEQAYNDYGREYEEDEREAERWAIMNEGSISENPFELDDIPFQDVAEENARLDDIYPEYTGETITINGQEKTVYNSEGQRIAKSKEALKNFYRWFGDSKVVDEQGRPLVVYHGTRAMKWGKPLPEFSIFSRAGSRAYQNRVGFFFGETESFARAFGDRIMPVYLNLQNPKIFKKGTPTNEELSLEQKEFDTAKSDDTKYIAQKILNNSKKYTDAYDKFIMDMYHKSGLIPYQNSMYGDFNDAMQLGRDEAYDIADTYREELQKDGYDGVIIVDTKVDANSNNGKPNTQYVAFEPNQIKSTSNRGTYSESENIYYQFAGEKAQTAALDELGRAKQLEAAGVDNEEIRQQTGWFKGVDGKWRFEISDKDADFNEGYNIDKWKENGTYFEGLNFKLGKILKHDKLFSAYPELKDVNIEFENRRIDDGTLGSFVKAENKIYLSNQLNSKKALSVIMHELQHVIQHKEGFASGGSLETKDVLEEKYKEIIEKYDYSPEMQALERDLDRYEFLYDIVNTLEVAENPQKIINKNWYKEKVFGTPKGKYRKSFIEEKAQQFIDEIKEKYLSKSSWYYSQYLEYVQDGKLKEIKKEMNALGKSTWRRMKKKKPSEYTDAKSFLWELENSGGYDIYRRLAGEIEARNTQARMELTEEERRVKTPESTQDVANADAIVVFDDGTAMAYKPETYYQEGEDRDLVALHSISSRNLDRAIDFGGFPAPSIAIVKRGQEFGSQFGAITLVGNKDMIDPSRSRNEVYNRDIWSKTFPFATYGKVKKKTRDDFRDTVKEYFVKSDSENELGSLLYYVDRGVSPEKAVTEFEDSDGARLMYLEKEKGKKIDIPTYDTAQRLIENINSQYGIEVNKEFVEKIAEFESYPSKEVMEKDILPLINEAIDNSKYDGKEKYANRLREVSRSLFIEDGKVDEFNIEGLIRRCKEYVREKGTKKIDKYALRDKFDELITDYDDYSKWAKKYIEDNLVGEPMVEVGKRLLPFNLENVTKAMTQGITKNAQESFVYGSGKVIAAGAKQLKSIKEIKLEGKKLVSKEEQEEKIKELQDDMNEFTNKFMTSSDFTSSMEQKEAAFRALGTVTEKENPTNEDMQKALNYEFGNSKKYSDELLAAGVRVAKSSRNIARYYFEAKPQRAVGLNEFSAAIMPTSTEFDAIAKKVEDAGLKVVRSDNQTEALQEIDTDDNVFFQSEQAPRGAYVNRIIYLNENANASTLPHELAHFWSDELRNSKSLRAKEILRTADKWENQEFERKYNVVEQDGKYIVTDKSGKTVYDKQGEGFDSEVRARAYAKEELFARGFEKYLKEGKAPNKTLRIAFRNFYNWLKKIYSDMMSLDIKLNKPMRNLYADILGGTSIDTFLDSDIDEFVRQRAEAEQDRITEVNKIISQAQGTSITLPERIRKAYEDFDFGETWKKLAVPLSTRAKRISPSLRNKLRRYEYDSLMVKQNYYKEIEPMLKKWREFSKEDSIAFDLALKNEVAEIRDEILKKYDAEEDFNKVREVLEDIYYKANDAGLEVGYIEDYFPRKVKDKDGLLSYLHGTDEWSGYQQALQREDPYNKFTAEEQADFLDKFLRGIVRADVASYKYDAEKARKLDTIDNTLNQYYADSMQALISYIDGMNARIQTVNFFGRNRENVEESIGEFIAYQLNNNLIKPNQVDEVKSILTAVFSRRGVNSQWIKGLRDVGYLYTMGGVNTAITQIDDIFVAAYKGGVLNTIQSVFSKDKITKKDLGLESIAAEFIEGTGASKAVNWVFKKNGIELIDGFGKNSLLNGVLMKMQKMSDAELREYLEPIMEDETEQTLQDVRNGELSDNVRFFLFNELSDMQPVSLSELPELYNTGGNMRILYMLKSFMLKRIDTIRNECYDKIRSDNKSERIDGMQNLFRLCLLMMIGGASKDLLIDLMYQRVIDLNDMLVNNLLGIIGISKYNIYQVREEGLGHSLAIFAMPPLFQVAEDLSGDVNKYLDGKRELKDFEVFKGLPIVGRFYYWLIGGGKTKTEKKKGKSKY